MSNVVKLKGRPGSQAKRPSDKRLIEECLAFAQCVAADLAGHDVDPSDSDFAAPMGDAFSERKRSARRKITELSAVTPEGVQAKARVVPYVLKDAGDSMDEREQEFFLSFAADVRTALQPIIDDRSQQERQATRSEVSPRD